jgi:hypothetical protein
MSLCPRCGATFSCGMMDGDPTQACWCLRWPVLSKEALLAARGDRLPSCYCPDCLSELTSSMPEAQREER